MCGFSRRTTVGQIAEFLASKLHYKQDELRLWHYKSDSDLTLLDDECLCLEDLGVKDEDAILVELRSRDASWPEEMMQLQADGGNDKGAAARRASTFNSQIVSVRGITGNG